MEPLCLPEVVSKEFIVKVLFLVLHRKDRSPGQRYRHEQYLEHLANQGIAVTISPLLESHEEDSAFYGTAKLKKVVIGLKALYRRFLSVKSASAYDEVYIYRDAFFFGTFFEKWLKRKKVKIIYDFDDAIWLMDTNPNQGVFNRLKDPKKTETICALADRVIVGNEYLAAFARQFCDDVVIIPSTIDFSSYKTLAKTPKEQVCIGWTGSFSTVKHLETIIEAFEAIHDKYGDRIYFKIIGDPSFKVDSLGIQGIKWQSETEVEDLSELDIGVMPLPDNEWTRGKCAMKGLQYMALEIPTIMSPVGINAEILTDGVNGFLASSIDEWVEKLSLLIEDERLRVKIGQAGKQAVIDSYSVDANKKKWIKAFTDL